MKKALIGFLFLVSCLIAQAQTRLADGRVQDRSLELGLRSEAIKAVRVSFCQLRDSADRSNPRRCC